MFTVILLSLVSVALGRCTVMLFHSSSSFLLPLESILFEGVPLVGFMHLVFTRMPGERLPQAIQVFVVV